MTVMIEAADKKDSEMTIFSITHKNGIGSKAIDYKKYMIEKIKIVQIQFYFNVTQEI